MLAKPFLSKAHVVARLPVGPPLSLAISRGTVLSWMVFALSAPAARNTRFQNMDAPKRGAKGFCRRQDWGKSLNQGPLVDKGERTQRRNQAMKPSPNRGRAAHGGHGRYPPPAPAWLRRQASCFGQKEVPPPEACRVTSGGFCE